MCNSKRKVRFSIGSPPKSTTCTVFVTVDDVNDNAPKFEKTTEEVTLTRNNAKAGLEFYTVTATDRDTGPSGVVSYSLTGGAAQFTIDSQSGVVTMVTKAAKGAYVLNIVATDGGTPSMTSTMILKVTILTRGTPISTFIYSPYTLGVLIPIHPSILVKVNTLFIPTAQPNINYIL